MNRHELIRSLKILLEATYITDDYRVKEMKARNALEGARSARYKDIHHNKLDLGWVILYLVLSLLVGGLAFLLFYAVVFLIKLVSNFVFNTSLQLASHSTMLIALIASAILALLFWILCISCQKAGFESEYKSAIEHNKHVENVKENLHEIERNYEAVKAQYLQRKSNLAALRTKVGLHQDYWEPSTIRWIIDILEHGRADSLKEAINLYEQESHQAQRELDESRERIRQRQMAEQQLQELQGIRSENARAATAAEEASRNAEEAAFWGEVNAYLLDKHLRK